MTLSSKVNPGVFRKNKRLIMKIPETKGKSLKNNFVENLFFKAIFIDKPIIKMLETSAEIPAGPAGKFSEGNMAVYKLRQTSRRPS